MLVYSSVSNTLLRESREIWYHISTLHIVRMPITQISDNEGDTMTVFQYDGCNYPTFAKPDAELQDIYDNLHDFKFKEDDVLVCSYPKTGTAWISEILFELINKKAEFRKVSGLPLMMEAQPQSSIDKQVSPRILNTHVQFELMPKELFKGKTKVVFIARNPKDVAVSLYHHILGIRSFAYSGKWENYLPVFMDKRVLYGRYDDYLRGWEAGLEKHPEIPVHVVYYEDLKENCVEELRKIAKFLDATDVDSLIHEIVDKCQFKNMTGLMDAQLGDFRKIVFKDTFNYFRKGMIGDWKNWFTVAQSEMFDDFWNTEMKTSRFQFRYTPAQ